MAATKTSSPASSSSPLDISPSCPAESSHSETRKPTSANTRAGKRTPGQSTQGKAANRLSIRVDLATGVRIGPGKVAVLEAIAKSGSISAAGRDLHISYRRTWELVEDLNANLGAPVVQTAAGGSGGGGASLTDLGQEVVTRYRAIEEDCASAARKHLAALQRAAKAPRPG